MYKVVIQLLICLNRILQKLVKYVFARPEKFGLCVEGGFSQIGSQLLLQDYKKPGYASLFSVC